MINYTDIGLRIRAARIKQNITQQALAELSEQTPTNISHIERGATKLSLPTIIRIANALSVSVDELLCDNLTNSKVIFEKELESLLEDCNNKEIRIIVEIIKATKAAIRNTLIDVTEY